MSKSWRFVYVIILLAFLAGCSRSTPLPTATATIQPTESATIEATAPVRNQPTAQAVTSPTAMLQSEETPLFLAIIWHQHQPVYFKDPVTGIYSKPWVRVHAAKDYVDMAAILKQYPDIHATFNLTPSLIRQLDDLQAGAKDLYWVTAEVPAEELTADQQQFLRDRFFDTNPKIIARFPRYLELQNMRSESESWSVQDYRDLQVLFNLAWTDPDWLAEEPLAGLVSKGSNYSEEDKGTLFAEHLRLINEVIPVHKELQDAGQIEVTMTPFAHPILPLLVSTDLAKEALPDIVLPNLAFQYREDAQAQVELGIQLYQDHFGRLPRGMWPAEGSVAQEIVTMIAKAGIEWMASDEGVLANSLGMNSFVRTAGEVVSESDVLYRPYVVGGGGGDQVAMVFRDVVISDKVSFAYSGLEGSLAAKDFISRLHDIREALQSSGAAGPHLVSVILDGENAWEYYDNDGKEFLHTLYQTLSEDPTIKTVTPSEFLAMAPELPEIESLWAGSWINHDYSTWIGESEENRAWEYLAETRETLQLYLDGIIDVPEENLEQARTLMYIAEGSDWFWWYGSDQNSGNDESFDQQYRDTLGQVYQALKREPPRFLEVPIISQAAVNADQPSSGLIAPIIDGLAATGEWEAAGVYQASGGAMASANPFFDSLAYGFDSQSLYFKFTANQDYVFPTGPSSLELYLALPDAGLANSFSRSGSLLGFAANRVVDFHLESGAVISATMAAAAGDEVWEEPVLLDGVAQGAGGIELSLPFDLLGVLDTGDRINVRAFYQQPMEVEGAWIGVDIDRLPGNGPAMLDVPDLGTMTVVVDVPDPENDDHGPGSYVYPSDAVFRAGSFDLLNLQIGFDQENLIFKFSLRGPVENPWGSPNGLAIQTFDIYIDKDGDEQGQAALLPGRNLALQTGQAWDFAITAEGWESGIFIPSEDGVEKIASGSEMTILVNRSQQTVTIRVPKSILGEDPETWSFAAMVLGQEGYPSGGVMRVRDVNAAAEQWRFGGAQAGVTNHTRVIDLIWSEAGQQEDWLSSFTPSSSGQTELTAVDFAQVGMFAVAH